MRDLSAANVTRQQKLFASGFVSQAAIDDAKAQFKRDDARVKELEAVVVTVKMPARTDEIRAAEADARAAREVLAQSEWRLAQRAVAAPAAGLVHDTYFVVGDWVPAGSPGREPAAAGQRQGALLRRRNRARAPEAADRAVNVALRRLRRAARPPTIAFIADRAEYTPPVLYSKENRAKLVYLVEAKPAPADAAKLHPGQPVDVTLPAS